MAPGRLTARDDLSSFSGRVFGNRRAFRAGRRATVARFYSRTTMRTCANMLSGFWAINMRLQR